MALSIAADLAPAAGRAGFAGARAPRPANSSAAARKTMAAHAAILVYQRRPEDGRMMRRACVSELERRLCAAFNGANARACTHAHARSEGLQLGQACVFQWLKRVVVRYLEGGKGAALAL